MNTRIVRHICSFVPGSTERSEEERHVAFSLGPYKGHAVRDGVNSSSPGWQLPPAHIINGSPRLAINFLCNGVDCVIGASTSALLSPMRSSEWQRLQKLKCHQNSPGPSRPVCGHCQCIANGMMMLFAKGARFVVSLPVVQGRHARFASCTLLPTYLQARNAGPSHYYICIS